MENAQKSIKWTTILFQWIIPSILIAIPVFLNLDVIPIHLWDESRLAINSYEMSKHGNFLIPTFEGQPDLWNTKPPLMIWSQVFWIKILGQGELAIRLPSAIAAFLTALGLILFSARYLKNNLFGIIAALVLVTSTGYIQIHASRTGDYDALLTFFTTSYILLFFLFLESGNFKYFHLFVLSIILSVYTKSIQGLIFLPALLAYALTEKKWNFFKDKRVYIDAILCILIIASYYLIRESLTPGYLNLVWENELGGRYVNAIENHKESFWFYFTMLNKHHFAEWIWFLPFGILTGLFFKDEKIRKITILSTYVVLFYWFVISYSETKLEWYEIPLFPFLAMVVAISLYTMFKLIYNSVEVKRVMGKNVLPFVLLFGLLFMPYKTTYERIEHFSENSWEKESYELSYFLKDAEKEKRVLKNHLICYAGYHPHLSYYVNLYNDRGWKMDFRNIQDLKSGDLVIATQQEVKSEIEKTFSFEELESYYSIKRYRIK